MRASAGPCCHSPWRRTSLNTARARRALRRHPHPSSHWGSCAGSIPPRRKNASANNAGAHHSENSIGPPAPTAAPPVERLQAHQPLASYRRRRVGERISGIQTQRPPPGSAAARRGQGCCAARVGQALSGEARAEPGASAPAGVQGPSARPTGRGVPPARRASCRPCRARSRTARTRQFLAAFRRAERRKRERKYPDRHAWA